MINKLKIKTGTKFTIFISLLALSFRKCNAAKLANPLGVDNLPELIGKLINGALGIVGSLALIMFIYGGLIWMTSGGNDEKIKKGKGILIWAIFGIVVVFTSYSILSLVFEIIE